MLKTVVMTGSRMELPVDLGIEKAKIQDRIIDKDNWICDGYASMYEGLSITAGEDNAQPILVSDYTQDKQENANGVADYIAMNPKAQLQLPRNREISALNKPMVCGQAGDILLVVAR